MENSTDITVATMSIVGAVLSAIVGASLTAFFYQGKLRKDQKAKVKSMVGETIFNSLNEYKNTIKRLNVIAPAFPKELYESNQEDFFERIAMVPEILTTPQEFDKFLSEIKYLRANHFNNLGLDTGATLYCLERYFMNLDKYLSQLHMDQFPLVGSLILSDLNKFYECITKNVYRELNKHRVKYIFHNGLFWKFKKKKYHLELWEKSVLMGLMFPEKSKLPEDKKELNTLIGLAIKEGVTFTNAPSTDGKPNENVKKVQELLNRKLSK